MGHKLLGSRRSYFDYHDVGEIEKKYMRLDFSRPSGVRVEELRKKQVLDMVEFWSFLEDRIKGVQEALAKYKNVDEAMDEIKKLSLEGYKLRNNANSDPKKVVDEDKDGMYKPFCLPGGCS